MTTREFNEKWAAHLEEGHYGLAIDLAEVAEYVDEQFTELANEHPHFTYSQIKIKWSSASVYLGDDTPREWANRIEEGIEKILWERENYK